MKSHDSQDLIGYLDGTLGEPDRIALERHLGTCKECRDQLSFVKEFKAGLAELSEEEFTAQEPCPDSWTLVSHEAGEVDEETARHLRVHLLFCDQCAGEFYALRRARVEGEKEAASLSWAALVERLKEHAIDFAKTYGSGASLGPARIIGERPAFALRGPEEVGEEPSKVMEVSAGGNQYSIEVALAKDGAVRCEIAGFETPREAPLDITIRSLEGNELFSAETDDNGNISFILEQRLVPQDAFVLSLTLDNEESHLIFRLPG
jgi:anti-sigma factor RsiW